VESRSSVVMEEKKSTPRYTVPPVTTRRKFLWFSSDRREYETVAQSCGATGRWPLAKAFPRPIKEFKLVKNVKDKGPCFVMMFGSSGRVLSQYMIADQHYVPRHKRSQEARARRQSKYAMKRDLRKQVEDFLTFRRQ